MDLAYLLLTLWLLERMPHIKEGMTKQEVVAILGDPDSFQRSGEYEALRYTTTLSGRSRAKTAFSVILKEGCVVEYGTRRDPSVNRLLFQFDKGEDRH
jgi:hypothetical protein